MIAIDTNILIYAHRQDSPWYARANHRIAQLAAAGMQFGTPLHCLVEFYSTVTRFYSSTPEQAIDQVDAWLEVPSFTILADDKPTWPALRQLLLAGRVHGAHAYDMRIVAVCMRHGVTELWTNDHGIVGFLGLTVINPLIDIQPTGAREPRAPYGTATRATPAPAAPPRKPGRGAARRR